MGQAKSGKQGTQGASIQTLIAELGVQSKSQEVIAREAV